METITKEKITVERKDSAIVSELINTGDGVTTHNSCISKLAQLGKYVVLCHMERLTWKRMIGERNQEQK